MTVDGLFNVKDYGAKGDGSNDTAYIQAALDAARDIGGGTVLFPAGNYVVGRDEKFNLKANPHPRSTALLRVYSGTNLVGVSRTVSMITAERDFGLFVLDDNATNFAFKSLLLKTTGGSIWQSPGGCSQGTVEDVSASASGKDGAIWYQEHREYAPENDTDPEAPCNGVNNPGWVQMRILNSEFSSYGEFKNVPAWYIATSGGLNGNRFSHCRFNDNPVGSNKDPKNCGTRQYAIHLERCHPSSHTFDNAFRDLIFERTTGGEIRLLSAKNCVIDNCHGYDYSLNGYDSKLSEEDGVDTGKRFIFNHLIRIGCGAYYDNKFPATVRKPGLVSENVYISNSGRRSAGGQLNFAHEKVDICLVDAYASVLENLNATPRDSLRIDVGQSGTTMVRNVHKKTKIAGKWGELKRSEGVSKWQCEGSDRIEYDA